MDKFLVKRGQTVNTDAERNEKGNSRTALQSSSVGVKKNTTSDCDSKKSTSEKGTLYN